MDEAPDFRRGRYIYGFGPSRAQIERAKKAFERDRDICPHTTDPIQLRSLCKACRVEDADQEATKES